MSVTNTNVLNNPRLRQPLLGKWNVDKFIGAGQYGKVYKVHDDEDEIAAVKIISMPNESIRKACEAQYGSEDELEDFMTELVQKFTAEVESMKKLRTQSKNIIEIKDNRALQSGIYWDVLIVMEYATPLKNYISQNGMTIDRAIRLMRDVASALDVCAKNNIIHRDIKDDNIFVGRDGLYKIGDFGVANMAASQEYHTQGIGTMNYMAPEVQGLSYDNRVDIYSLGIVLYKLFNNGRLPFVDLKTRGPEANKKRLSGEALPSPENAPHSFARIILKCCEFSPEDRYLSAEELIQDLDALRSELDRYELSQEIPVKRKNKSVIEITDEDVERKIGVKTEREIRGEKTIGGQTADSRTVSAWKTYDITMDMVGNNNKNAQDELDDITHDIYATLSDEIGRQDKHINEAEIESLENKTTDLIRRYTDELGPNSPIVKKLMEKNKLLENEKQQLLRAKRSNKIKKIIISVLTGSVVVALICILLVIISSTSYFANESDYHKIYSRSIVSREKLFDDTEAAYLSVDSGYLYFSEISHESEELNTCKLCRINIKNKTKSVVCEDSCYFDVVIGDYVYFTSGPNGAEYLYRIPKDGMGQKQLLLEASCYDLRADGKTLIFKVLDMNGQERKINTTKIEDIKSY